MKSININYVLREIENDIEWCKEHTDPLFKWSNISGLERAIQIIKDNIKESKIDNKYKEFEIDILHRYKP